jgi:hypothetical protein
MFIGCPGYCKNGKSSNPRFSGIVIIYNKYKKICYNENNLINIFIYGQKGSFLSI